MKPICRVRELGRIDYLAAFQLQEELVRQRLADAIPDTLLLLEHPPVITLGRRGTWRDVLVEPAVLRALGIDVQLSTRGGLVTYHGPGQLVAYPITRLRHIAPGGVPDYVRGLEEAIIRSLSEQDVPAFRDPAHPGVWTRQGKIAAVGVALHRGITLHGVAVNLQPDLSHFECINPCGLAEMGVTSVQHITGRDTDLVAYGRSFAARFASVFYDRLNPPTC